MDTKPCFQLVLRDAARIVQAHKPLVHLTIGELQLIAVPTEKYRRRDDRRAFVAVEEWMVLEKVSQSAAASSMMSA